MKKLFGLPWFVHTKVYQRFKGWFMLRDLLADLLNVIVFHILKGILHRVDFH